MDSDLGCPRWTFLVQPMFRHIGNIIISPSFGVDFGATLEHFTPETRPRGSSSLPRIIRQQDICHSTYDCVESSDLCSGELDEECVPRYSSVHFGGKETTVLGTLPKILVLKSIEPLIKPINRTFTTRLDQKSHPATESQLTGKTCSTSQIVAAITWYA